MAVISCPSCKKKISDKAKSCSHCQLDLQNFDEEKFQTINKINLINKSQKLMIHSFIAILLFCGGFLFFYLEEVQLGTWQYTVAVMSTVVGFVLYLVTRIRLFLLKRSSK
ncbi:hypothetical protein [Thalassotalea profundi]|uniref:Putative zinc-ribbon domain-containing protein n=1 Tax=Thalassotalea profundi TaxID=2036687 RepID=A0ABQ3IGE5_9GAMM|nr:hypothetical protein [Thalassotalea profundi]GHE82645.1 hypothetical protein GCM10011501_08650 [Thalassotalea profundi]